MRIKVTAIVCDSCGNRFEDKDEKAITQITITGPDETINGKYDLCLSCRDGIAQAVGVDRSKPRPSTKRKTPEPWSEAELNRIQEMIDAGEKMKDIADMVGRTPAAIYSKMKKLREEDSVLAP